MNKAHLAKASIRNLKEKLAFAEERKKYFEDYLERLHHSYSIGKISYAFYVETLNKYFDGRTIQHWVDYYERQIKTYKKEIRKHTQEVAKSVIAKNFLLLFLMGLIIVGIFYIPTEFTGFVTQEIGDGNVNIITSQGDAILGQPVRWTQTVSLNESSGLTIQLPQDAENIEIKRVGEDSEQITFSMTGGAIGVQEGEGILNSISDFFGNILGSMTGGVIGTTNEIEITIEDNATEYEIEYETPAPYAIEEELINGKKVKIVGSEEVHYENVLAFTNLSETLNIKNPSAVKIYWIENDSYVQIKNIKDTDSNGIYDYIEWIAPSLSEQTFRIIVVIKAEHLDSNRESLSNIYDEVKTLDNVWSEEIADGEYIRVTFEVELDNSKDITVFPRVVSGNPRIEVYEQDGNEVIAEFSEINSNEYNKVYLTSLQGTQDTFDLKVVDGSLELDYIVDPAVGWWNESFEKRKEINITNAGSELTNFPAFINVVYESSMQSDYDDLRFVSGACTEGATATELDYELEFYNTTEAHLWVEIPTLSSGTTSICLYYGNSSASSGANTAGVWDSDYAAVYHFNHTTGDAIDTMGSFDLTDGISPDSNKEIMGVVGRGDYFDGGDYLGPQSWDLSSTGTTAHSWCAWVNFTSTDLMVVAEDGAYASGTGIGMTGGNLRMGISISSSHYPLDSPDTYNDGQWHYFCGVSTGSTAYLYVDGAQVNTSSPGTISIGSDDGGVGYGLGGSTGNAVSGDGDDNYYFTGQMDEARFSYEDRSADWINMTYQIIANQGTIVTISNEQSPNSPPTTPTNIQCNGNDNCNISVDTSVILNASGSTDEESEAITYFIEAALGSLTVVENTTDVSMTAEGGSGSGGWWTENGEETFSSSTATIDISKEVDTSKAFILLSVMSSSSSYDDPDYIGVYPEWVNGTRFNIQKETSSGDVTVVWQVVEGSNLNVQNGTYDYTTSGDSSQSFDITIDSVDVDNSVVFMSWGSCDYSGGGSYTNEIFWTGNLTSATNLQIQRDDSEYCGGTVAYFVVEFNDGSTIQQGEIDNVDSSATYAYLDNAINMSDTWFYFSTGLDTSANGLDDTGVRATHYNTTAFSFERYSTGGTARAQWYAISTPEAVVQYDEIAGATSDDVTISEVVVNRSISLHSYEDSGSGTTFDNTLGISQITTTTNLHYERGSTSQTQNVYWHVVQFPEGSGGDTTATNETNTTATTYEDINSDYNSINNITVKVEVDSYDPRASVDQETNDPDLWLEIYNSTDWVEIGIFDLPSTYTGTGLQTNNENFSLIITNSAILSAWQTSSNQDIRIKGVYMDHNSTLPDTINYTNVWVSICGCDWVEIGNHTESTTFTWDTSELTEETGIDLRARAIDLAGSNSYSSYFTKGAYLNISHGGGGNTAPQITFVSAISTQNPTEASTKTITFSATMYDADGVNDLNDASVNASFSKTAETTRYDTSCSWVEDLDANSANYSCSIDMWYFDGNGLWNITVYGEDMSQESATNDTTTFTYNLLTSMVTSPNSLSWAEINLSSTDVGSSNDPIVINNTGNADSLTIDVTAYDLQGETTSTEYIRAHNFSVDVSSEGCSGTAMVNASATEVSSATLSSGNYSVNDGSTGQEQLYFCLKGVPQDISSQSYSSTGVGAWTIRILLVAVTVKKKRKKKKPKNDKLIQAFELIADELKEEYSLNKEELIKVIIDKLKDKYKVSKKEIMEIVKDGEESDIPINIFSKELGCLEALCKYMKENLNMSYQQIAEKLNRDERTIWTAYHKAKQKQPNPIIQKQKAMLIPLSIFRQEKLTILESIILYLKEKGMKYSEIANLLDRDQRNIWTVYSRIIKKLGMKYDNL